MKKEFQFVLGLFAISCMAATCKRQPASETPANTSLVNTSHLDYLYTPFNFSGENVAGIYIYSQAPDYHVVADADEGFTCVDDVARAIQVYMRSSKFSSDSSVQSKTFKLIRFVLKMQSANGYFYNFLFPDLTVNRYGPTSLNSANWWSWRALYALSEAEPVVKLKDPQLAEEIHNAINGVVSNIKTELIPLPEVTKTVNGIEVPTWLPAGSGTDQAAILILGLILYCETNSDPLITAYIKKLSDGIAIMQRGDATHFPYSCILSWENTWHAYAADQALALMKAGVFLQDDSYTAKGLAEVDNFFSRLLTNGMRSSFEVENNTGEIRLYSEKTYEQIAYGVRPMISAAMEAYKITKQATYADMAGHFAAWFSGLNDAGENMYSTATGRCFDGIGSSTNVNHNSGAESTIEALLAMEAIESDALARSAYNKYKKQ